jgi:hypothetical protein
MMDKSTTEARRYGENLNHFGEVSRFDIEPWEWLKPRVLRRISDRHERNSSVRLFSVPPCHRGGCSVDGKERSRP